MHGKHTLIKLCKTSEVKAQKHYKIKCPHTSFISSFRNQSRGGDLGGIGGGGGVDFMCVCERKLMWRIRK